MPTWTIRIDRRKADRASIAAELAELAAGVRDLDLELFSEESFWQAPDDGGFRDFVPIARLTHPDLRGLEFAAEELLEAFGWLVDFQKDH